MFRLDEAALPQVPPSVRTPGYDRSQIGVGIVHFGVGGFHRSHQAMYLDRLLNVGRAREWGICGVGVLPADREMERALVPQDGLYTLVVKHPDGGLESRVIGSIVRFLFAPDDPRAVLDQLTDPAVRIVSLTVTEGGYSFDATAGRLDTSVPALAHDLAGHVLPRSVFGFLTEALRRRRAADVPPFTVMSCDNIEGNGDLARAALVEFSSLQDRTLGAWIEQNVPFPNSMVDRITPVTTDEDRAAVAERLGAVDAWPVVCEPFAQWVIEDSFADGRPPLEDVGVQFVDDVTAYELMKLRLLNGGHQALAYLGYLSGYRYAHQVCRDPLFVRFLLRYMDREAIPTLRPVPGIDLDAYKHQLIERFGSEQIQDTLARLCADTTNRIPRWLVPMIETNLERGGETDCLALVLASWARYAEGVDEQGEPIVVVDPRAGERIAAARAQDEDDLSFIRDPRLFGGLAGRGDFVAPYRRALTTLRSRGARAALEQLVG